MPAPEPDPYAVLGVARSATDAEIRAAYHALVARYHPDRHQGNPLEDLASQRMAEINRAYETLSDRGRRAAVDAGGSAPPTAPPRPNPRAVKWALLIIAVPLLLRVGGRLGRELLGLTRAARGTPLAMAAVLLVTAGLVVALYRRRRR